jgi:hypothetical protein
LHAGIDAGGLSKEWFLLLVRELFDEKWGMFNYDPDSNLCWFNPASLETISEYSLLGTVLGLAIYNSTILDLAFPLAIFKKLLGVKPDLKDLSVLRPSVAKGLQSLLDYKDPDLEDVFCLTFEFTFESFGENVTVPLIPNGDSIPVTQNNKKEYVGAYVNFILNSSIFAINGRIHRTCRASLFYS